VTASPPLFRFPPFQLDVGTSLLWRGTRQCRLRPRAVAVLRYLIEHAGQVVSQEELLTALWPGVKVSTGVLKVYVWEIRRALHDRQQRPRFIETLPRRGYRWIAPLSSTPLVLSRQLSVVRQQTSPLTPPLGTGN
jgi:DNA-binding winged helix-turn-helix (wHTH) protein